MKDFLGCVPTSNHSSNRFDLILPLELTVISGTPFTLRFTNEPPS